MALELCPDVTGYNFPFTLLVGDNVMEGGERHTGPMQSLVWTYVGEGEGEGLRIVLQVEA